MNLFIQLLTYFRIIAAPAIFILITVLNFYGWALLLFMLASASDYWDGFLARRYKLESTVGAILDPIADKILVTFLILALSIELSSIFVAFAGGLILVREFWVGALRDMNARNHKSDATKVTFLAKIKTSTQLFTISLYLLSLTINNMLLLVIADIFLFISLFITIYTGFIYTLNSFKKE